MRINPDRMLAESDVEDIFPNADMSNFVAWYRHLSQAQPTQMFELTEVLKNEVLDGFLTLYLPPGGEKSRPLLAKFGVRASDSSSETPITFRFGELSDGQRSLIALYALVICAVDEENTLCLDQPENHLALPEIQPWLMRLVDATDGGRCQAIIATHHPELINLLAAHSGYWLERESGGPTRVRPIDEQDASGLALSELIARGWLHE
jgi:predicted ATPase